MQRNPRTQIHVPWVCHVVAPRGLPGTAGDGARCNDADASNRSHGLCLPIAWLLNLLPTSGLVAGPTACVPPAGSSASAANTRGQATHGPHRISCVVLPACRSHCRRTCPSRRLTPNLKRQQSGRTFGSSASQQPTELCPCQPQTTTGVPQVQALHAAQLHSPTCLSSPWRSSSFGSRSAPSRRRRLPLSRTAPTLSSSSPTTLAMVTSAATAGGSSPLQTSTASLARELDSPTAT